MLKQGLKRLGLGVLGLMGLLLLAAGGYAVLALPKTSGLLALRGAQAELRLLRDAHGVPTVQATSLRDASFGLGVAHAQDRLWQMETHRRIAAGRLAEAFGPGALQTDRFVRALGVRRAAQAQWDRLPAETRIQLQAYADGVNAVLQQAGRALPPEFLILGLRPEPWTPVDSLGWALMMAWDLGGNWTTELLRLRLALQMPVDRVNQMLPPYPGDEPPVTADYAALFRSLGLGGARPTAWVDLPGIAPPSGVEGVGSNNWVLAGSRSSTGQPLLANDPHLKLSTPALWYFARLGVPGLKVAGATLPGLPHVVLGQNEHLAWGYTNTGPDVQDLYIEQIDPANPARYRTPQGWAEFETEAQTIRVKGQPDVPIVVRRTRHGPVISDAQIAPDLLDGKGAANLVLALRWTALDADNDTLTPALAMQRADSVAAFIAATRSWVAPMQSMVVADRAGRIGLIAPGRVPLRRPDNDLKGLVPSPGWDARYDWLGWVPADETPRETDPARGWIATANQRITADGYPHHLTFDWAAPWRQWRIEQLLQAKTKHSLADLAAMQADERSLAAAQLLPWLLKAASSHPLAAAAQAALKGFDGQMSADAAAPLIYWAWQRQLARGIFADDAGAALWERSLGNSNFQEALHGVLSRNDASWCDDRSTPDAESCEQQSGAALTRALDDLRALQGDDVSAWRWGRAHQARGEHRPFSRVPLLARWFELRTPVGGDTFTVNVSRVGLKPDATTGEIFLDEHGPSLRALYDLADPAQSRVVHSTGQSGLFFSKHYRDQLALWARGDYLPLWPQRPPTDTLHIVPAR